VTAASAMQPMSLSRIGKARLVAQILWTYVAVRQRLRRADLQTVVAYLRNRDTHVDAPMRTDPHTLGRAVRRTLRLLPTDSRCLMQSLVLTALLARAGVSASLVIGVAPGPEFKAHAWVEAGGCALLPSLEPEYQRLTAI